MKSSNAFAYISQSPRVYTLAQNHGRSPRSRREGSSVLTITEEEGVKTADGLLGKLPPRLSTPAESLMLPAQDAAQP